MRCHKCGKEIMVNQYHDCEGTAKKAVKNHVFQTPVRNVNSTSYLQEQEDTIITPGFKGLTASELKTLVKQGNGLRSEISRIVKVIKSTIKKPTPRNIIVMVSAAMGILIWAISSYSPYFSYMPQTGMKGFLAITFGTYNNVFARVLHFSSVFTLLSVFIPQLMKQKSVNVGGIAHALKKFKTNITNVKSKNFGFLLLVIGLAYVFGNMMMRNNSMNKYLACATFGVTILLAARELRSTPFVRIMYALMNDITRLFKMEKSYHKYGGILRQGFGLGLVSTVTLSLLRGILPNSVGDILGYFIGTMLIVAGIVFVIIAKGDTTVDPI